MTNTESWSYNLVESWGREVLMRIVNRFTYRMPFSFMFVTFVVHFFAGREGGNNIYVPQSWNCRKWLRMLFALLCLLHQELLKTNAIYVAQSPNMLVHPFVSPYSLFLWLFFVASCLASCDAKSSALLYRLYAKCSSVSSFTLLFDNALNYLLLAWTQWASPFLFPFPLFGFRYILMPFTTLVFLCDSPFACNMLVSSDSRKLLRLFVHGLTFSCLVLKVVLLRM